MTNKNNNRRKVLKSIAAGSGAVVAGKSLPESWSKPLVKSLVLPVHAMTTTPEVTTTADPGCSIPTDCYFMEESFVGFHIFWPGGTGPYEDLEVWDQPNCSGFNPGTYGAVVAAPDLPTAEALFDAASIAYSSVSQSEATFSGCTLFIAQNPPP